MAGRSGQKKTAYTPALGNKVCELLEQGHTLTQVCTNYLPQLTPAKVFSWKRTVPEFREQYRIARESGLEIWTDKIFDMSQETINVQGRDRQELYADMQQRKNQIDIVKFLIIKGVNKLNNETKKEIKATVPNFVIQNYATSNVATADKNPVIEGSVKGTDSTISNGVVLLDGVDSVVTAPVIAKQTIGVKVQDWGDTE